MFFILLILSLSISSCFSLENSNSSSSLSQRSPREELGIIDNVERIQNRDKKGKVIREYYSATLSSNTIISVDATFDKKNTPSYLGFWRRGDKPAKNMTSECAAEYFGKLKLAYLQNNPTSGS